MNKELLTKDWNANPNDPQLQMLVEGATITLEFYVNAYQFENFNEDDKARVRFLRVHKYALNGMNDEGYYTEQYRYTNTELHWGEFYKIDTDWQNDFPKEYLVAIRKPNPDKQNHYIFFFKDDTFECVAEGYKLEFLKTE